MLIINNFIGSVLKVVNRNTGVRGVAYPVARSWDFATIRRKAFNRKDIRVFADPQPLWRWSYVFNYLKDNPADLYSGNTYTDLQELWGDLLGLQGQFGEFLYQPPDSALYALPAAALVLGTPDANGNIEITHPVGSFNESVQELNGVTPSVYFNGVLQGSPTISSASTVPPYLGIVIQSVPAGRVVSVNFTYYYRCVLSSDSADFEQFMYALWKMKKFDFEQIRL